MGGCWLLNQITLKKKSRVEIILGLTEDTFKSFKSKIVFIQIYNTLHHIQKPIIKDSITMKNDNTSVATVSYRSQDVTISTAATTFYFYTLRFPINISCLIVSSMSTNILAASSRKYTASVPQFKKDSSCSFFFLYFWVAVFSISSVTLINSG